MSGVQESNLGMGSHWRFDAVDLRAGLGFAAWRADIEDDSLPGEVQIAFFAPPFFTPEPVANVALALGATRGSLRPGLFVAGREVWFDSLAQVSEFLRRAYLASGGGDGGDGGGGDDPSPPLPDPPDLPDGPAHDGDFDEILANRQRDASPAAHVLLQLAAELQRASFRAEPGTSGDISWRDVEAADGLPTLCAGATHVLRELLMRRPPFDDTDAYLRWRIGFRSWWMLVGNLGLRSLLLHPKGTVRRLLLAWAYQHEPWLIQGPDHRYAHLLILTFLLNGDERTRYLLHESPWLREHWERLRYGEYSHPGLLLPRPETVGPVSGLSMTNLRSLPLPRWAWNLVGADLAGRASLYHVLCTLTAQPQLSTSRKHFELMLFACGCIVGGQPVIQNDWPLWAVDDAHGPSSIEIAAARQVACDTVSWLKEHLPKLVFSASYEEFITTAKDARYRG